MKATNKGALELLEGLKIYPQLLINIKVKDKELAMKDKDVLNETEKVSKELGENGRILVRPSGTEPLVRVMVEAESDELCKTMVGRVTKILEDKFV